MIRSNGPGTSYVAGHPDAFIIRESYLYQPSSALHGTYVFVLEGSLKVGSVALDRRDSIGRWDVAEIVLNPRSDGTDVLIVETILS